MSTGPRRSDTTSSILSTCSGSVTSRSTAMAWPPEPVISSATRSDRSRVRAARATPAPASTRARANASPRPVLPPVTTTVLPVRSKASRTATLYPLQLSIDPAAGSHLLPAHRLNSLSEKNYPGHGAENAADYRPNDRDPRVSPIVPTLTGNGQHGVRYARPQVAGRVDGITGRTSERKSDAED